jgi:hypothetical protein
MSRGVAHQRRASAAMSRDISARTVPADPLLVHLERANAEAARLRLKVAEVEAELKRACRCLASARLSRTMERKAWQEEREGLLYKIKFAARHIARLKGGAAS